MPMSVALPSNEAELIRSRLDERGIPALIDIHTHFMPMPVLRKVWGYFAAAGPLVGRAWPIAYQGSDEERLATLRSFGVRRFSSLNYPHKPQMAQWLNEWSAGFADAHPDCLRSATFYPEPEAGEYVRVAIADGVQVFKAHVQVGAYDMHDPLLDEVWAALEESGIPVILHGGDGPVPGEHTGVGPMRRLMERFPDLTMVAAHMGMPDYGEFLDLASQFPRVYLDTTMAFTAFTEEAMPFPKDRLDDLEALGDRVLLGTDFPNIPYPYLHALDAIFGLGMSVEWERKVLHDNASGLLGVDRQSASTGAAGSGGSRS
ncbi:MAG TPA: amidohydrolase [Intrasporangiaceae bacterium]|nr:amidohydrolase [Intrasporangiaceae bacterium]